MSEKPPADQPTQPDPPTPATQPAADAPAGWGAPQPPATRRWPLRRTLIATGVAVVVAATGGVAIYAASGSTDTGRDGPGRNGMPPGGGAGGPLMMFEIPHGEFQTGEVTALSDTEITAESEDGYSRTYAITDETATTEGVAEGDTVTIVATTEGDEATATSISELTTDGDRRGGPPNAPNAPGAPRPPN